MFATLLTSGLLANAVENDAIAEPVAITTPQVEQVKPPFAVSAAPTDATTVPDGLSYRMEVAVADGPSPGKNDLVMIKYTGWRSSGETFYTTRTKGQPLTISLSELAPGFAEALQLMKKGEKAFLWIPGKIAFRNAPPAGPNADLLELVDITAAPPVPTDVAGPDRSVKGLKKSKTGIASIVITAPTDAKSNGVRAWDKAVFNYTSWDSTGHMIESSVIRNHPATTAPYDVPAGLTEALTGLRIGERKRFWIPQTLLQKLDNVAAGTICYEIELLAIEKQPEPPAVPNDVAKPPARAKKTKKGVFYKYLTHGTGTTHPSVTDEVRVHYTGWTTDGKMFDSSVTRGEPAEFRLSQVIAGWTDGVQLMVPGDKVRFWIPEALAYKGRPGAPGGMLVFDVELLEINPQAKDSAPQ